MTAETLNFGPEWLRALSRGGSVTSPPPSPAMPKSKLADYRYGREEMLALYVKDNKIPEDMQDKEFAAILQEEPQQPLALVPLTEEEQRNFSMSVNSVAVLRLMGKGGGAVPTVVARGRGSTRGGRGRGRGEGGFYQRSVDEEVGFGRGREMHRSQSWDDRSERRFEKPLRRDGGRGGFEEGGAGGRKDYVRSDSDNWRTLREEQEDDDGAEPDGEGGRRRAGSEGGAEERDGLPEWCTDEEEGEMGTFDSSGAFMCIKKSSRDAIPEDQELEFEALEEEEEGGQEKDSPADKSDTCEAIAVCDGDRKSSSPHVVSAPAPVHPVAEEKTPKPIVTPPSKPAPQPSEDAAPAGGTTTQMQSSSPPSTTGTHLPTVGGDTEEEDGMKHLQQEAEKMVASLQDTSLEEECFTQALQESHITAAHTHTHPNTHTHSHSTSHTLPNSASALPLSHESAMKWFYKDPQGEIQGPFTTVEMCEWFQAGYFSMNLLVKRGCDEGFQPLGEVIKMWGRVPFSPGPSPPPLLGNMDQEVLKKQLEQAATAALYKQLQMRFQHMNRCGETGMMPAMNRSMSVPDTGPMWDMPTSVSQQSGGDTSLWDLTMSNSTQGPTLEHLQKIQQERREAELRKRDEEERKRREEKRRQQEEQKRREEEELYRRKQQCRQQQELIMKFLQQSQQQQSVPGGAGWSGSQAGALSLGKATGKSMGLLELEAERLHKQQQQRAQQQQRHGGLTMGQWSDGPSGMWSGAGMEGKVGGGNPAMGMWDEAMKNQASHRNIGLKNSRSSPSLSDQYMLNRHKRTDDEERLLKLLQGMKPQDGFTTWCEQMLHALNTSANNSSSVDVPTIVAYLKEVESPYEVHDFIRIYLGDTIEAKEFAKQFLERRAKQKANHQRQKQQLSKEVSGLNMNFPLQSMFQAAHMSKGGSVYDTQGGKTNKKPSMMLHSDPSILGYSFLGGGELEQVEDY
ncbi:PERQ amino acid-rich with GYF domain-containing protein 1-like [Sinocyclocheilus anshuiensis]|uniref:PERQ amino acid-rich with GYF domain-containing protein 1-like n=1 Tax=Sinocyclocheilus anshuiensis TaxID=1608454 RepID=A0A671QEX8_9TELE|nr:PREDICTED: PERQ amino acid-rich with GYF domain-containing protein 1-like [Sinocyclocheilus anshuiensis]